VRFHPGAAYAWLGVPLYHLLNLRIPLTEFWKDSATRLSDEAFAAGDVTAAARRIEAAILARLSRVGAVDRSIARLRMIASARGGFESERLADVAREIGLSERTMRRRCVTSFGYGLRTLTRIIRFQRFFGLATQSSGECLADMAVQSGFSDQPHLAREVKRLSGFTTVEFVAQTRV